MEVRLVYQKGRSRSQVLRLQRTETLVGRQPGCDIRIPSAEVSRKHCLLRKERGTLTVEDLQSVNGTCINGRPVVARTPIRSGDRLQIGPVTFLVEYDRAAQSGVPTRRSRKTRPIEAKPARVAEFEDLPEAEILDDEPVAAEVIEDDLSPIVMEDEDLLSADLIDEPQDANAAVLELVDEGWELPDDEDKGRKR